MFSALVNSMSLLRIHLITQTWWYWKPLQKRHGAAAGNCTRGVGLLQDLGTGSTGGRPDVLRVLCVPCITFRYTAALPYLLVTLGIVPTRWVFVGRHHCLICAQCVSRSAGYVGIFGKSLKRAIWNAWGLHAVLTTCLRLSSFSDGACVACCLSLSTGSYHSAYKFTPWDVASPDAPQKPLVSRRARSGAVKWVQMSQDEPGRKAKKPCTAGSRQPACTHKEH